MYIIKMWIDYESHDITYFNGINKLFDFNKLFNYNKLFGFLYLKLFTVNILFFIVKGHVQYTLHSGNFVPH